MDIIYDLAKKRFLDSFGLTRNGFTPTLAYGEKPIWRIELVDTSRNDGTPDVSRVSAWRSAIDTDFRTATSPMCRTTEGIVQAQGNFGVAVLVPIDSATERYLEVCDGRRSTACWFELAGLDAAGDTVFYVSFPISALFPIDPSASGDVVPVEVTDLTRTQVEAIAKAASADALAAGISSEVASQVTPAVTAALADYKPLPSDGTAGQVLTKTEDGAAWGDSPSALPSDGTAGQVLTKTEDGAAWGDSPSALPSDGTAGQVLTKTSDGAAWGDSPSALPTDGTAGQVLTKTEDGAAWGDSPSALPSDGTAGQVLTKTEDGAAWGDSPSALPSDGTAGQVLTKTSDGAAWGDSPSALPSDGTAGQVLTKTADGAAWGDSPSALPSDGTAGQVLTKTATGVQWAAVATEVVRMISSLSAFDALVQEVKDSKKSAAFLAIPGENGAEWSAQDGYIKQTHFYLAMPLLDDCLIMDLTALGSYSAIPTSTAAATLEIEPGQRLAWTLEADSTLSAKAIDETHWATAQIEISPGAHKVTAGSNIVITGTLSANAVNVCEVRWRAGAARLRVVDVITGGGGGGTPPPSPTITAPPTQSVEGKQGEELTASILTGVSASNGASVSFAVKQGSALPAGLALSAAGDVTGTPAAAGNTTTTVVVSADGCADVEMSVSFAISEAAVSDGFPKSFTVSSVSYQGQSITAPCGTYTRTGEAFPVVMDGVAYPVYSYTGSDGKTYYICVVAYMFGGDAPAWMLTGTKPTASSVTTSYAASGYGGVTLKSGAYEPSSTSWSGNQGSVTVSWEM